MRKPVLTPEQREAIAQRYDGRRLLLIEQRKLRRRLEEIEHEIEKYPTYRSIAAEHDCDQVTVMRAAQRVPLKSVPQS